MDGAARFWGIKTGAGTEATAKKDSNAARAKPRSDGQTEAEAEILPEAAGMPGDSALARGLQKEGKEGGSPSFEETWLPPVGKELEQGEDREEREAEVWPISVEAGKMAAKLLAQVKDTWEELGQFCASKVCPIQPGPSRVR